MTDSEQHSQRDNGVGWEAEPVDPDTAIAPRPKSAQKSPRQEQVEILVAIGVGGVGGAAARYGAGLMWPTAAGTFPWTTFWINVLGCGFMGVLMVLVTERFSAHPLVRPFLGTGILGGFTTFSSYAVDTEHLLAPNSSAAALIYVVATILAALAALWIGATTTRLVALGSVGRDL